MSKERLFSFGLYCGDIKTNQLTTHKNHRSKQHKRKDRSLKPSSGVFSTTSNHSEEEKKTKKEYVSNGLTITKVKRTVEDMTRDDEPKRAFEATKFKSKSKHLEKTMLQIPEVESVIARKQRIFSETGRVEVIHKTEMFNGKGTQQAKDQEDNLKDIFPKPKTVKKEETEDKDKETEEGDTENSFEEDEFVCYDDTKYKDKSSEISRVLGPVFPMILEDEIVSTGKEKVVSAGDLIKAVNKCQVPRNQKGYVKDDCQTLTTTKQNEIGDCGDEIEEDTIASLDEKRYADEADNDVKYRDKSVEQLKNSGPVLLIPQNDKPTLTEWKVMADFANEDKEKKDNIASFEEKIYADEAMKYGDKSVEQLKNSEHEFLVQQKDKPTPTNQKKMFDFANDDKEKKAEEDTIASFEKKRYADEAMKYGDKSVEQLKTEDNSVYTSGEKEVSGSGHIEVNGNIEGSGKDIYTQSEEVVIFKTLKTKETVEVRNSKNEKHEIENPLEENHTDGKNVKSMETGNTMKDGETNSVEKLENSKDGSSPCLAESVNWKAFKIGFLKYLKSTEVKTLVKLPPFGHFSSLPVSPASKLSSGNISQRNDNGIDEVQANTKPKAVAKSIIPKSTLTNCKGSQRNENTNVIFQPKVRLHSGEKLPFATDSITAETNPPLEMTLNVTTEILNVTPCSNSKSDEVIFEINQTAYLEEYSGDKPLDNVAAIQKRKRPDTKAEATTGYESGEASHTSKKKKGCAIM